MPFNRRIFPSRRRLHRRDTAPAPIDVSPSQSFDGVDGQWSTFLVSVGTPPQNFRVLASTQSSETWVISPDGCTSDDPTDCQAKRGGEPFNGQAPKGFLANKSSTWEEAGLYSLDVESDLGLDGAGLYGYDMVGLNGGNKTQNPNGNGVTVGDSVVAAVATKDYFLGVLGLGIRPTSFSSSANHAPSFLDRLKDLKYIPSLSFAYTAGAVYRNKNTFGSLTLGGYDTSRFEAPDKYFSFSDNDARTLQVGIQSITATNTLKGTASMTTDGGHLSLIDSTVAQLWLPESICQNFEESLGLIYDNQTGYYLINDTMHTQLQDMNPSFTFKLGDKAFDDGNSTNIELPYSAFDVTIGWPTYNRDVNYFPIRRAANESQYVIGRAFLQEAYLIVDYERKNFTIAQAKFPSSSSQSHIVPITPKSSGSGSGKLSAGAIAGIAVGAVLVLALIAFALWFFRRKKVTAEKAKVAELEAEQARASTIAAQYNKVAEPPENYVETGGTEIQEMEGHGYLDPSHAAATWKRPTELPSPQPVFEMAGDYQHSSTGGYGAPGAGTGYSNVGSESQYSTMDHTSAGYNTMSERGRYSDTPATSPGMPSPRK